MSKAKFNWPRLDFNYIFGRRIFTRNHIKFNIIQRFFELQFGKVLNEEILLSRFHDCLEKINKEGVSVLNDFTFFHKYLNDGVRSQKTNQNIIYGFIHFQIFALLVFLFSGLSIGVFNLLAIISLIICEYLLCWLIINIDKQNFFIHNIFDWSKKLHKTWT